MSGTGTEQLPPLKIGLIGGTGLGQVLASQDPASIKRHRIETPFGPPSDDVLETNWNGVPVFCLSRHGPGHLLNPSQVPFRANLFALKSLGVTHVLASGAVGSLRDEFRPRDLVVPDQIIDKTFRRPGTFYERAAVHVEFAEPFCPVLRQLVLEAGKGLEAEQLQRHEDAVNAQTSGDAGTDPAAAREVVESSPFSVHDRGCYVCMEGPAFSTRAESLMHRLWGGDLIGMTAMPEAKLAREAEISYSLIALVTDYDCWRNAPAAAPGSETAAVTVDKADLLKEIIGNVRAATENAMKLMQRTVALLAERHAGGKLAPSPAHEALSLAIWSEKSKISPDEVQRLSPLWIKYFGQPTPAAEPATHPSPAADRTPGSTPPDPDQVPSGAEAPARVAEAVAVEESAAGPGQENEGGRTEVATSQGESSGG